MKKLPVLSDASSPSGRRPRPCRGEEWLLALPLPAVLAAWKLSGELDLSEEGEKL